MSVATGSKSSRRLGHLPEKVSDYTNITSVFAKIQRRGQLSALADLVSEIKRAEESELSSALKDRAQVSRHLSAFRTNIKALVQLVSTGTAD